MSVYGYKYGRVPEALLYSDASDRACRLHAILTRWSDTKPDEHPTRRELAGFLHCSLDSVDRAIKELEGTGFLKIIPRYAEGVRIANIYTVDIGGGRTGAGGSRTDAATNTSGNGEPAGDGGRTGAAGGGRTGAAVNKERDRTSNKPRREPAAPKPPRPEIDELCQLLADRIIGNGGSPAVYQPRTTTAGWRDAMRLLVDKDLAVDARGQPVELTERLARVRKAINWCQDDDFWHRQILSPSNLRAKYDRLRLAAMPTSNGRNGHPPAVPLPEADLSKVPPRHDVEALDRWVDLELEGLKARDPDRPPQRHPTPG